MNITAQHVNCLNRDEIPDRNKTFADDFDIEKIKSVIPVSCNIYLRDKLVCPFGRGNWLIDITFNDGGLLCIKLPSQMNEMEVIKWAKPLIDLIGKK